MRILFALTYYQPHVSDQSVYVQRLAEALSSRGHEVTVLTSRFSRRLPKRESLGGVTVLRSMVAARMSGGVLMPGYLTKAIGVMRRHDVVVANLPMTPPEALTLATMARSAVRRPIVVIYHRDIKIPAARLRRALNWGVFQSNLVAARMASRLVAHTEDYADHSLVLRRFRKKRTIVPPPVTLPHATASEVLDFRRRHDLVGKKVVGMVARTSNDEGLQCALDAIPQAAESIHSLQFVFSSNHDPSRAEPVAKNLRAPTSRQFGGRSRSIGPLDPIDPSGLASFYAACDITLLPAVDATESFGLVQVESMLSGTPVVVTDLPGVRQPVTATGMGRIVPPRDVAALGRSIVETIQNSEKYVQSREAIEAIYSTEKTAATFEALFQELAGN